MLDVKEVAMAKKSARREIHDDLDAVELPLAGDALDIDANYLSSGI